jgi:hypothetical protein
MTLHRWIYWLGLFALFVAMLLPRPAAAQTCPNGVSTVGYCDGSSGALAAICQNVSGIVTCDPAYPVAPTQGVVINAVSRNATEWQVYGLEGTGAGFCCVFSNNINRLDIMGTQYPDSINLHDAGAGLTLEPAYTITVRVYGLADDDDDLGGSDYSNLTSGPPDLIQQFFGGWGDDTINARTCGIQAFGEGDDDTLNGGAEPDILCGGPNDDTLESFGEDDLLWSGTSTGFLDPGDVEDGGLEVSGAGDYCQTWGTVRATECETRLITYPVQCP